MAEDHTIFLPGSGKQFNHLKTKVSLKDKDILIIGSNSEKIAQMFLSAEVNVVTIILDEYDSLLKARYLLKNKEKISVRLMDSSSTDFNNAVFDIVYAQASISSKMRNKIIKEIKRILKPEGILNVGEITSLKSSPPKFVDDIWESGNISPLNSYDIKKYYEERKFEVVDTLDLSAHLKDFYLESKKLLFNNIESLSENEKAYYKKLLKRMSHESNAYLKLGGKDYMGFTSIIVRRIS
ncbi:MAG: methyltransferase domain-containing protein [Bacteroidetes bacterium]|nr:methyltransferase domain-containing protein [Bacteroidota bacterium]